MKIKKVFIKNFKGIEDKKIIELNDKTSIMIGPNGFGKTTIFDVLELCLTGKINRTFEKRNVTNDNKDYKKPFYQNMIGKDVVVKVWIEKETEKNIEDLVIVKFLPKDNDGKCFGKGRRNKPCDFDLMSTYREETEDFDSEHFIPSEENKIDNNYIDNFFDFSISKFKIENIYKLFNYLQQEDTTYFLKKSENDRKDSLGFLFQTKEQEEELDIINNYYFKLNSIKEKLKNKIIEIKKYEKINKKDYFQLFPNKKFDFDKKDIFHNIDLNNSKSNKIVYFEELNKLLKFIEIFSPDEYVKKSNVEYLTRIVDNSNFINFYLLQNFLDKTKYDNLINAKKIIDNENNLENYILQKFIGKYKDLESININYDKYEKFIKVKDYTEQLVKIEEFISLIMPDKKTDFENLIINRNNYLSVTNDIEKSISEIIRLRNSIRHELDINNSIEDNKCPYCGIPWRTYEDLILGFVEREDELRKISNNQLSKLEDCNKKIDENFIQPIRKYMVSYIEENNKVNPKILRVIKRAKDNTLNNDYINKNQLDIDLIWSELSSYVNLKEAVGKLRSNLEARLDVDYGVYNKITYLNSMSFMNDIEKLEKICQKDKLGDFLLPKNSEKKITINDLERNVILFKDFLEKTKVKYKYDFEKTYDDEKKFESYFNKNKEEFFKLGKEEIELKKNYIESELIQKQNSLVNIYEQRLDRIDVIINRIDKLRSNYDIKIKDYKKDMVNKIKIPFYIYTSKMLQNYQQGMGVFLSTQENTDSIRFLTDSSSDHDAMHHLSSGQLAVVSLAFCLAINKTYNISNNLKFLLIDDPVQEMDALNIHSFIELMRHEFIEDYQLIFSTHNDTTALYIKYKFEKIIKDSVNMINVQNKFFS